VKTHVQFEAVCGLKSMSFRDDIGDPMQFAMHLSAYVYRVLFRIYRPLKLPLNCEIVGKGGFGAPDL